jgi:hypothetical protein
VVPRGAWYLAVALALAACGHKSRAHRDAAAASADAAVAAPDAATGAKDPAWAPLDGMPRARPRWSLTVPLEFPNSIATDIHGPLINGDDAVVAGSQLGVAIVDLARRAVRFQVNVPGKVPLPVPLDTGYLAISDCMYPVDPPPGDVVVGCYDVVDNRLAIATGGGAIFAKGADALGPGAMTLAIGDDRTAEYGPVDGDRLQFDIPDPPSGDVTATKVTGRDRRRPPERPSVSYGSGDDLVQMWLGADNVLELYYADPSFMTDRAAVVGYATAPGALYAVGDRAARAFQLVPGASQIQAVVVHADGLEINTLGNPVPGIMLLGAAQDDHGFAIAVRLDTSLLHDYVAAFTADGTLAWVYPLPPPPGPGRTAPVGLGLGKDAVVVFRDGAVVDALPLP